MVEFYNRSGALPSCLRTTAPGPRGDPDWRNAKSPGLRLVILLVERLGGTIELDRTAGTTFNNVVKEKQ